MGFGVTIIEPNFLAIKIIILTIIPEQRKKMNGFPTIETTMNFRLQISITTVQESYPQHYCWSKLQIQMHKGLQPGTKKLQKHTAV